MAHRAVDVRHRVPAAPVPGRRGRERRPAPSATSELDVPPVPAGDQPVRAADRVRRPAALSRRRGRCRHVRPGAADARAPATARAGGVPGRSVRGDGNGDRRNHRAVDDGEQRSGHAAAAAAQAVRPRRARRPGQAAARDPPRRDRGDRAARLRLLPVCGRGLCARRDRADLVCGGGAVRARHAGRHLLEARHPRRRVAGLAAGFAVWLYTLAAALLCALRVAAAELSRPGAVGSAAAASARAVRPGRARSDHACDGVEHARQRLECMSWSRCSAVPTPSRALRRSDSSTPRASAAEPPALWRGQASLRDLEGLLARFLGAERTREAFAAYATRRGAASVEALAGRRRPGRFRRDAARRRDRLGLGASDGGLGGQGGSPGAGRGHEHPRRDLPGDRLQQGARAEVARARGGHRRSCAPPTSGCRSSTG